MRKVALFVLFLFFGFSASTQVDYTANDTIRPYEGYFRAGTNLGAYPGFSDEFLAEIAAGNPANNVEGLGIKALRPGLFESFLYQYGYDSRVSTYELMDQLGLEDNTLIVGFPAEVHQDQTEYCPGISSTLFSNLYLDIWDNGENGTPVNDDNHYALYIYKTAQLYGDYIKFWEIWNEPGFDFTENRGWLPPGSPGNWWENNPDPCDYKLRAPIFHYVRLLRISYEVIKSLDPDAYIAVSGVGYPSFLDAILRNSDNPNDGSVTTDYPLKGGAYFDVMGFHSYPHFDGSLRYWDNDIMDFVQTRHSDAAADGVLVLQDTLQGVLNNYGYDGNPYPEKPWIITEINLPRKEFGDFIGSEEAQRNFMIKNVVICMQNNFLQNHIFKLAEDATYEDAFFEFDVMGLYQKLDITDGYFQKANDEGIAYKTASEILYAKVHDPIRTEALALPAGVKGGAFKDEDGNYTYVLWAATSIDKSEAASATYSFPATLGINNLLKRTWNFSRTGDRTSLLASNIELTGAPIFLTEAFFSASVAEGCAPQIIQFTDQSGTNAVSWNWTFTGGSPSTSTSQNPTVSFTQTGTFDVILESFDNTGNLVARQMDQIKIGSLPIASFSHTINGALVDLSNSSSNNSVDFLWDFGDGNTSTDPSPKHLYLNGGTYTIQLTASNSCGSVSTAITLDIITTEASQLGFTANDQVPTYQGKFRPGSNTSFYPPWTDEQLGNIAAGNIKEDQAGAGVKSFRTILPHFFLEFWGYEVEKETFEHYNNIDLRDNVATIGFPSSEVRDTVAHCPEENSILFKNIYTNIWDDGSDGTPINEENEFARYLYHTVQVYKDNIRFWEIMSGPDFDSSGEKGWLPPGEDGNWWENDPDPCDYAIHAPIQYYVRMLRISYEIIKTLDPDSYVTIAGIGFPSFIDAVLRNTDNPIDGSIVDGYPLTGGAYFDAIAYNALPHFDGSTSYYDTDVGGFVYERHSDAAAEGIVNLKEEFETVLFNYGYDGTTYPEKQWYISGCNIPRKQFGNFIGSESAQINFVIKAYINSVKNNLTQFHIRQLADNTSFNDADDPFDVMGLYQYLENKNPYDQQINHQGVAYKTTSDLLFGSNYDAARTSDLALPATINGAAFVDGNGDYTYVLWAKTMIDQAETASAIYDFPASLGLNQLYKKAWNYSATGEAILVNTTAVELTGAPVFLTEAAQALRPPLAQFKADRQEGCAGTVIQFEDESIRAEQWEWTFVGADITTSTLQHPSVTYLAPGNYPVRLKVSNAGGDHTAIYSDFIIIDDIPTAGFNYVIDGSWVNFTNASEGATSYLWDFGDNSSNELSFDPEHYYFDNGTYEVRLIAINDCGQDTLVESIVLNRAPEADFNSIIEEDCGPYAVQFQDLSSSSPETWTWNFEGGMPTNSNDRNPVITFEYPGNYEVSLTVSNAFGNTTVSKTIAIDPEQVYQYSPLFCSEDVVVFNNLTYSILNPDGYEILENAASNGCDSVIIINIQDGTSNSALFETICQGDLYDPQGYQLSEAGVYTFSETNSNGCDSIITINLEVNDTSSLVLSETICQGDLYDPQGYQLSEAGVYTFSETNSNGCDSIITINLEVNDTYFIEISDTILEGTTYTVGSSTYTESGTYENTLTASNGCDSIVLLNLFVDIVDGTYDFSSTINLEYFPNPFDKNFNVQFDLPQATTVSIDIFNVHGVRVEQLQAYQTLASGSHHYTFSNKDLPQGVYFIYFRMADSNMTFRVVHL